MAAISESGALWSGCKSSKRFRQAGATRREARRGCDLQGCRIAPDPKG